LRDAIAFLEVEPMELIHHRLIELVDPHRNRHALIPRAGIPGDSAIDYVNWA
jgi:hypothetical protein